jgi:membrane protein DedA with SNARE-associated domain
VGNLISFFQNLFAYLGSNQLPQLGPWTYIVFAVLVAVEGPIVTLLGAAAASAGLMRSGYVFLSAATGNLVADSLWYTIGYMGKIEWILRIGQKVGIRREILERLQRGMHKHSMRILFIAKLTVSFMIPSLIAAGLVKAPWKRWFPAIFSGEMIWTGTLVLIGYHATQAIKRVERGLGYAVLSVSVLFVISLLWMGRRVLREGFKNDSPTVENEDKSNK